MKGGLHRLTADGVVGISGKPCTVYGVVIESPATAGEIDLYDGTSASGTKIGKFAGASSQAIDLPDWPAQGRYFPSGCFCDFLTNAPTSVSFHVEVETTA